MKKEVTKFDRDGNKNVMIISYRIKCIDSTRFMASSLSNLVDNLAEESIKLSAMILIVFL